MGGSPGTRPYRLAVDIGGTFTDVVLTTESGGLAVRKILSTPEDYAEGVIAGARAALADLDVAAEGSSEVVHATTVATNAILERAGARCALITTAGFRDVLEIGRLRIPELFNPFYDKRPVLVPRDRIFEVDERINHRGEVVTALGEEAIERAVEAAIASDAESVAVCLLNSYANPDHEHAIADALRARAPELDISVSADILPRIGEFERTSTTTINAYVRPTVRRYVDSLAALLRKNAIEGPLLIMQSGGGLMGAARAAREPVNMIESGPAAGVLAARHFIAGMGLKNAVTFDMGGTTAKASIIENGEFLKTSEYEVGGHMSATTRLTGGGGYPVTVPAIDIAEVGAGGGSIVWLDSGGSLRVGPRSAGAAPGPVCYGAGGERPTVTDANLILGYLNPARIAGGAIEVLPEPARVALEAEIARPLGLDLAEAAYGVHLIANSEMIGAIRAVSTQRGRDVRDFALVAFGGCGPAHAAQLAREMGIGTVVVPPSPGLFSAFGLLATELEFQRTRTLYADAAELRRGDAPGRGPGRAQGRDQRRVQSRSRRRGVLLRGLGRHAVLGAKLRASDYRTRRPRSPGAGRDVGQAFRDRARKHLWPTRRGRAGGDRSHPLDRPRAWRREWDRCRQSERGGGTRGQPRRLVRTRHRLDGKPGRRTRRGPARGPRGATFDRGVRFGDRGSAGVLGAQRSHGERRAHRRRLGHRRPIIMTQTSSAAVPEVQGDPVTFELVKNALFFMVNEMALTLVRASYSGILRENMDFSTGIASAEGEMIAQGLSLPLQFGPMPDAVAAVRNAWEGRMQPDDVFILNDPFEGGTHLPDFFFVKPGFPRWRSVLLHLRSRPSGRRGRPGRRLERLRLDRGLRRGPARAAA